MATHSDWSKPIGSLQDTISDPAVIACIEAALLNAYDVGERMRNALRVDPADLNRPIGPADGSRDWQEFHDRQKRERGGQNEPKKTRQFP